MNSALFATLNPLPIWRICTREGVYVTGFSTPHQCVQEGSAAYAKKFASKAKAETWGNKYADAGYGLTRFTVEQVLG